jgi:hypothetical protein
MSFSGGWGVFIRSTLHEKNELGAPGWEQHFKGGDFDD